jgi:hypothetical protein
MMARRSDLRIVGWLKGMPCEWNPMQVINPETDMPFSDSSAWQFIADLLESNHPFREVKLRNPIGDVAYETEIRLGPSLPKLYIKIQKKSGRVVGRSFHNSLRR